VALRTASLEASNKELEAFSYSMAHDLRTPLRSMLGFSHIFLEEYGPLIDPQGQDYLNRIQKSTLTMSKLIDDLLNLSHITRTELTLGSVDLGKTSRQVSQELQSSQPARSVEFILPEQLVVKADSRLIRIALENLLGNAWKFTSKSAYARIEFGSLLQDEKKVLFVRDNGVGFDMAYKSKLFSAFQRLHPANEFEGSGIGLSIVHRIIHRHGGQVWAEGEIGRGATFYFTIP
jgi:light-regulated signal transduction histidine kinase (bacteriophytochrome)